MKKIKAYISCVLAFLVLACTGCAASGGKEKSGSNGLPRYEELSALIGLAKADTLDALGLQEEDLVKVIDNQYKTPIVLEYAGFRFDVLLHFNAFEDSLGAIEYVSECSDRSEAARNIHAIAKSLDSAVGKTSAVNSQNISEMQESELAKAIGGDRDFYEINYWDITDGAGENINAYLKHVEGLEYWELISHHRARYYLTLEVVSGMDKNAVNVMLAYGIRPEC